MNNAENIIYYNEKVCVIIKRRETNVDVDKSTQRGIKIRSHKKVCTLHHRNMHVNHDHQFFIYKK